MSFCNSRQVQWPWPALKVTGVWKCVAYIFLAGTWTLVLVFFQLLQSTITKLLPDEENEEVVTSSVHMLDPLHQQISKILEACWTKWSDAFHRVVKPIYCCEKYLTTQATFLVKICAFFLQVSACVLECAVLENDRLCRYKCIHFERLVPKRSVVYTWWKNLITLFMQLPCYFFSFFFIKEIDCSFIKHDNS